MNLKSLSIVIAGAVIVFATAIGPGGPAASRAQTGTVQYEADLSWPQPLPSRQPHGIAIDSKGNVYVAENRGKRIHKFRPVGRTLNPGRMIGQRSR